MDYAILRLIMRIIDLYMIVLLVTAVMSWLIAFNVMNRYNGVVATIWDICHRLTEPALRPIRRFIPSPGGLDLSFIVLWLGLLFLKDLIFGLAT